MELDDLKKSWNLMDERLKDKELINEEDINKLIHKAGKGISDLSSFSTTVIVISALLILPFIVITLFMGFIDWFYSTVAILAFPAVAWDIYTNIYLRRTRVDEMPTVQVIARINRLYRWSVWESVAGIVFMLTFATLFFIDRQIWHLSTFAVLMFFVSWVIGIGVIYWLIQYKVINRLRDIRKNLKELKELKELE